MEKIKKKLKKREKNRKSEEKLKSEIFPNWTKLKK